MRITLLGTGTPAPNPRRLQSAVLVESADVSMLIDAGRGAVHQMGCIGTDLTRLQAVLITHHHADHINDLFDVIITTALAGRTTPLSIYGPPGTSGIVRALIDHVYDRDIRSRRADLENQRRAGLKVTWDPDLLTAVECRDIEPGDDLNIAGLIVRTAEVLHGRYPTDPHLDWRCYGYRIESDAGVAVISGDTVMCPGIVDLATNADLLIQCCHFPVAAARDPYVEFTVSDTLPTSRGAGEIAAAAGVDHVILTHLSNRISTAEAARELSDEVASVFAGQITVGEDLMVFELPAVAVSCD